MLHLCSKKTPDITRKDDVVFCAYVVSIVSNLTDDVFGVATVMFEITQNLAQSNQFLVSLES